MQSNAHYIQKAARVKRRILKHRLCHSREMLALRPEFDERRGKDKREGLEEKIRDPAEQIVFATGQM